MNGSLLALASVAAIAGAARVRGSRSMDDRSVVERAMDALVARGGVVDRDSDGIFGPPPLRRVILSDIEDEDGDPGAWINWIEGTTGSSGAWRVVEEALVASGARFAAGETNFKDVWNGWKRRGFQRISREHAESLYFDTERGNTYFLKWFS